MSLMSFVNDGIDFIGETADELINAATGEIENIIGSAKTAISNLYDGGFVGMSKEGFENLNQKIETYCKSIEEEINKFNEEAKNSEAYAGEISTAVHEYVKAIQGLLTAYVSTMRINQEQAILAFNQFHSSEQKIAQNITQDAQSVTKNAEQIRTGSAKIALE